MDIEVFNEPIPHIIINNTFDDEQYQKVWEEIQYLAPKMRGPETTGAAKNDELLENGNREVSFIKRGKGIFLSDIFVDPLSHSEITQAYSKQLNDPNVFKEIYEKSPSFLLFKNINHTSTLVQNYSNSDEYRSHKDAAIFTMVTLLYKEPKVYSGGDFCFTEFGKTYTVPLSNNRTVIFCSAAEHMVTEITSKSEKDEDCRFTISNFLTIRR